MKTLWTFGDSFTFGHGCREDCNSGLYEKYKSYKSADDDIWPNKLSKLLQMNLKNLGVNGYCNNLIIDSIIDNYDFIQDGDCVIIGKSSSARNHIPYNDNLYTILSPHELTKTNNKLSRHFDEFEPEIVETIINFQYYFSDSKFYKEQQDKRIQFLVNRLYNEKKVKKCIVWDLDIRKQFPTIIQETNGKITDYHFSWKGHSQFTKYLFSQFNANII
jgi:hypothetical protein